MSELVFPTYAAMPLLPPPKQGRPRRGYFTATPGECWLWRASLTGGYGQVWDRGKKRFVHRVVLGLTIEPGYEIDHLCRNKACCNPEHLEIVTHPENMGRTKRFRVRKTHCPRGHLYSEENTYTCKKGKRSCRECRRIRDRRQGVRPAMSKRTECPRGHPYDDANTYTDPRGARNCRTCRRQWGREWSARKHA